MGCVCPRYHDRFWLAPQELLDEPFFFLRVVVGVAEEDLQTPLREAIAQRTYRIGEIGVVD